MALERPRAVLSVLLLASAVQLPVPFVPQEKDTCGAAALAMVMGYWGREVPHGEIAAALVERELCGIRGSRLADFARGRGTEAFAFAGDMVTLRDHLARGRPLVVAIDAGRGRLHDVVVVGFDDERAEAIVHDPARGPGRRIGLGELEKKWAKSGHWTLLCTPKDSGLRGPEKSFDGSETTDPPAPVTAEAPREDQSSSGDSTTDALGVHYDDLVSRAVEAGRDERYDEAAQALDRAIALEPGRPEAWTERGGVRFLEGRYEDAVVDLRRSLALREDAYARDLVASSLHLAGREIEALAAWNAIGRPSLRTVEIGGLQKTSDAVARREVGLAEGATLTPAGLRAARRRLEETGVFERVTLRPRPRGDGTADLEVALAERHGFAQGPLDFLVTTGVNLAWKRVRLRYSNLGGTGVSLGASARWQENRAEAALQLQWPRPLGVPATLHVAGFGGEQAYELGGAFDMRRSGVDASLRHVLGGGTVARVGVRLRDRSFSTARPDAPPGLLAGVEVGLDARVVESRRHRLDATARLFGAGRATGSDVRYVQAEGELRFEAVLSRPEGLSVERSVIVLRARGGWGSDGLPVDEMYAPGVSPESDLPLRAHPLTRDGALGVNPIGRSVVLVNAEWRQRLLHRPTWDLGAVTFADGTSVWRPADGSAARGLLDAGVGLRLAFLAGPTLRVDHAWGLMDGRRTLFVGLSQAF
ncbi:MAG TPA: papain-like cysteine protease family protein [Vicinamibacteria bacterium]|nr:papain-like cysteine protease family protein [Vicinamibacteria bacterium]